MIPMPAGLNNGLMQPGRGALGMPPMRLAGGGAMDPASLLPAMMANPGSIAAGLIKSDVPGRTDQLGTEVPEGTYVIPADVVSGFGQGNTMAGGKYLDKLFKSGPFKTMGLATGGGVSSAPARKVPVVVAGGEYMVPREWVAGVGRHELASKGRSSSNPNEILAAGHDALDRMVLTVRKQIKNRLGKLPGPKR